MQITEKLRHLAQLVMVGIWAGVIVGLYNGRFFSSSSIYPFSRTPIGFSLLVILPAGLVIIWELSSIIGHFRPRPNQ